MFLFHTLLHCLFKMKMSFFTAKIIVVLLDKDNGWHFCVGISYLGNLCI